MQIEFLIASVIGLVSGTLSGFLGVGGGVIMVPAFIVLLHRNPKVAVATSLGIIIPTALVGVWKHQQARLVDWPLVGSTVLLAMMGGYLGALLAQRLPARAVEICFGLVMIAVGIRMLWPKGAGF